MVFRGKYEKYSNLNFPLYFGGFYLYISYKKWLYLFHINHLIFLNFGVLAVMARPALHVYNSVIFSQSLNTEIRTQTSAVALVLQL